MALDPRIGLSGQPLNLQQAIMGGLQIGQGINNARNQGIRDAILKNEAARTAQELITGQQRQDINAQTIAANQTNADIQAQKSALIQANHMFKGLSKVSSLPAEELAGGLARMADIAANNPDLGLDPQAILNIPPDKQAIQQHLAALGSFVQDSGVKGKFQFGEGSITNVDGQLFQNVTRKNPNTGAIEVVKIPVEGDIVSKQTGKTAEEKADIDISTAGGKQQVTGDIAKEQALAEAAEMTGIEVDKQSRLDFNKQKGKWRAGKSKALSSIASAKKNQAILDETANQIKSRLNNWTTSYGASLKVLPASQARVLAGLIDTMQAHSAFNTLVDLKASGGTLGAISGSELDLLKAKLGSLDQKGDTGEMVRVVDQILAFNQDTIKQLEKTYQIDDKLYSGTYEELSAGSETSNKLAAPEAGYIDGEYRFLGGDASDQNNWVLR